MSKRHNQVLRFFDRLPGPAAWTLLVKFTIIHSGNYETFMRQCLSNTIDACTISSSSSRRRCRQRRQRQCEQPGNQLKGWRESCGRARAKSCDYNKCGALAQALNWDRFARFHHIIITTLYLLGLIKYALIDMISNDSVSALSSYHYVDCYILGRFRFFGRTNKISGNIACVFLFVFLVYRWTIYLVAPKFKFYALDFLLSNQNEVQHNELIAAEQDLGIFHTGNDYQLPPIDLRANSATSSKNAAKMPWTRQLPVLDEVLGVSSHRSTHLSAIGKGKGEGKGKGKGKGTWKEEGQGTRKRDFNMIFYLQSPFDLSGNTWILRPNRSSKSWDALNLCCKILFYGTVCYLTSYFALIYWAVGGSILSNFGYELSYPTCVSWLRDIQRRNVTGAVVHAGDQSVDAHLNRTDYSYIYRAPNVLAHEICIDKVPARISLDTLDFQHINTYSAIRILSDLIENQFLYLEFMLQFVSSLYLLVIHSTDVFLNASAIKQRLMSLLVELERRAVRSHIVRWENKQTGQPSYPNNTLLMVPGHYSQVDGHLTKSPRFQHQQLLLAHERSETNEIKWLRRGDDDPRELIRSEITDLQAILADHFGNITLGYNLFVSFFLAFPLLLWLLYTMVLIHWLGSIKSRAVEFEFVLVEIGVTVLSLVLLSGVAIVRSENVRLYPLIVRAMALDPDWATTKPHWLNIIKYFFPRSHFCFTLFNSFEISWLLNLKIIFWTLSAFIVLANFYYMNRS